MKSPSFSNAPLALLRHGLLATACLLLGCKQWTGNETTDDGIPNEADRRDICRLLEALEHPDQSRDKIVLDATPEQTFGEIPPQRLAARLEDLESHQRSLRIAYSADDKTHAGRSPYVTMDYDLATGCQGHAPKVGRLTNDVSGLPGIDVWIDVRHEVDDTVVLDCLWLPSKEEDFFRFGNEPHLIRFFFTQPNGS
jgi:hypothetical protein